MIEIVLDVKMKEWFAVWCRKDTITFIKWVVEFLVQWAGEDYMIEDQCDRVCSNEIDRMYSISRDEFALF